MDNRQSEKLLELLENEGQITNELLYSVVNESRDLRMRLTMAFHNVVAAEESLQKMYKLLDI